MSFKCSIFGHDYGDPEVERDREEEGSEVVITIRETETCNRCGTVRVVSENKEVTTVETAADIVAEDLTDEPPAAGAEESDGGDSEEGTDEPAETEIPDAETEGTTTDTGPYPSGEPHISEEADDAVILEEDEPEEDREPGEWPEEADTDVDDSQPQQSVEAEGTEREPGEWPEDDLGEDDEWKPEIDPDPDDGPTIERTDSAVTVPEGEFHCPECGYTTPVEASSLRAGDFCPECHRGALEHHLDE